MKALKLAILGVIAAGSAVAGTLTYVAPVDIAIEQPTTMGGSGSWIIPLIIISVLALALFNNRAGTI